MIYVSNNGALSVTLIFFLVGSALSLFYTGFSYGLKALQCIVGGIPSIFRSYTYGAARDKINKILREAKGTCGKGIILKIIFIFLCGPLFALLNYVFADGDVRLYLLLAFTVGFILTKKYISPAMTVIYHFIYRELSIVFYIIIHPFYRITLKYRKRSKEQD